MEAKYQSTINTGVKRDRNKNRNDECKTYQMKTIT